MIAGKELTSIFKINAANISGAAITLNLTIGDHDGNVQKPTVSVNRNTIQFKEGIHYNVSYDDGFTTLGTYTVRVMGVGNFTGSVDKTFKINAADLGDIKVEKVGMLTYNGELQKPTASASAISVNNHSVVFYYSTEKDGT